MMSLVSKVVRSMQVSFEQCDIAYVRSNIMTYYIITYCIINFAQLLYDDICMMFVSVIALPWRRMILAVTPRVSLKGI